ncbi:hypothetical protein HYP99_gp070 [Sinorhizobium phage ort11]|uniref:Uncharacterized protein n=1 Tax=Sinorhizobium phage ort11 TaxID=2599764 RepID=A0A5C2H1D0_9CAUD|nr:hypothetical protein HYP99_gp070 [Sinorhizobium phage ort11]QEP29868.1 hypothetical protein Smphiort11_070 [Sinorhizobium phage ort11]
MGLFSSSKKTYVSSVAYNLAGDEDDRPNYLRSLVTRNILSGTKEGMGDTFRKGYLGGPGIRLRSFYNWAVNSGNYDEIGIPTGFITDLSSVDGTLIPDQIPGIVPPEVAVVQNAEIGDADYTYWAEKWMLDNYPELFDTAWTADYLENTNQIKITFADLSTTFITPSSPSFNINAKYLYVSYVSAIENQADPIVTGSTIPLTEADPFPSTTGWTDVSNVLTPHVGVDLTETTRVVVTYSDGSPGSDTTTDTHSFVDYLDRDAEYQQTVYNGAVVVGNVEVMSSTKSYMFFHQFGFIDEDVEVTVVEEDMGGGVTKTTTTTVTSEFINYDKWYRVDTQDIINNGFSSLKYYIYRIGSGNAVLDSLVPADNELTGQFFPFIPVRIENEFLSESHEPVAYGEAKKGYKKAMKASFDKLVESIEDNDDLDDIDFAYAMFGVSLNVKENACKKYLYYFFRNLMDLQTSSLANFNEWKVKRVAYDEAREEFYQWQKGQANSGSPYFGEPKPSVPSKPVLPSNIIRMANTGSVARNFDIRIHWNFLYETDHAGLSKPDAKVGEFWLEKLPTDTYNMPPTMVISGGGYKEIPQDPLRIQRAKLYWQVTANSYKVMNIEGMLHKNFVYNGKSVDTSLADALDDTEESGFVVPLHYPTYKAVSLIAGTQMSTACCFILFNCYQIVKQRWYERGIFKILFVIVIAIISVAFTGGAGFGLLGSNLAIGSALGFSGLTAAIVGSVANALAAMVLSTLIEAVTKNLGFLGPILGALFGMFVSGFIQGFQAGFQFNWADLMKVDNILKLTDAVSGGYSAYVQSSIQDMAAESRDIMNNYQKESERISELYSENIGYANNIINPNMFLDSSNIFLESGDTFLTRTLMTGSDIANMSHDMLNSFTELTLTLPNAYA